MLIVLGFVFNGHDDWWVAGVHEDEVHEEAARPAVTVVERVDVDEPVVRQCRHLDWVQTERLLRVEPRDEVCYELLNSACVGRDVVGDKHLHVCAISKYFKILCTHSHRQLSVAVCTIAIIILVGRCRCVGWSVCPDLVRQPPRTMYNYGQAVLADVLVARQRTPTATVDLPGIVATLLVQKRTFS